MITEYCLRSGGVAQLVNLRRTCHGFRKSVDQVVLYIMRHQRYFFLSTPWKNYDNNMRCIPEDERWLFAKQKILQWFVLTCIAFMHEDDRAGSKQQQKMFVYTMLMDSIGKGHYTRSQFTNLRYVIFKEEFTRSGDKQDLAVALSEKLTKVMPTLQAQNILCIIQMALKRR